MISQAFSPTQDYKVLVHCNTYNHLNYIEDALNGFAIQQTHFPFVCLVIDDCSTDGEPNCIKKWANRECEMSLANIFDNELAETLLVPHKTNSLCVFAFCFNKRNLWKDASSRLSIINPWREHCEYEALCEGDDYWTDPLKLQRQVDVMEKNANYSMCFHNAIIHWEKKNIEDSDFAVLEERTYTGREIYEKWIVPTASVLIRREVYESDLYQKAKANNNFCYGDIILFLSAACCGQVYALPDKMSVYRRQPGGVVYSWTKERIRKHIIHTNEIKTVFGKEYKQRANIEIAYKCYESYRDSLHSYEFRNCAQFLYMGLRYSGGTFLKILFHLHKFHI